jgi:cyclophilin family peptidyl-prolyl cis-trans isomerase
VLARQASAEGLPAIIDAYQLALADTDGDARSAALRYIAAAWNRDSAKIDQSTRMRLSQLVPLRDPLERAPVRSVSAMSTWSALGNTRVARPLAEYELIARRYLSPGAPQPTAIIRTERGDIRIALHGGDAPLTIDAFTRLARQGFYRNTRFHRVVPNFVAQDGDPRGDGGGGAGFTIRDEHTRRRHQRGCLGVATSGPETGGSQFYLCHAPQPHLDGGYTVFGQVIEGLDVLDRIVQGDRVFAIEIR